MLPSLNEPTPANTKRWVYASLTILDGQRRIKPAQVSPDHLLFTKPPHLVSDLIEIILTNGDEEQRSHAIILPHDPDATRIPIRLLGPES